jgi:aspartyl-tRNA(Asn)/glutamyl-tRNA(Gln) amidotransferase subunit A
VQRDELVYRVGAVLESALEERWGGPLWARVPDLAASPRAGAAGGAV